MKESPVAGSLLSSLDVGDAAPSTHPNALCVAGATNETKREPYVSCGVGVTSNMEGLRCGSPFFVEPWMAAVPKSVSDVNRSMTWQHNVSGV